MTKKLNFSNLGGNKKSRSKMAAFYLKGRTGFIEGHRSQHKQRFHSTEYQILNNKRRLRFIFESKTVNYEMINLEEFSELRFNTKFFTGLGVTLLRNFGKLGESRVLRENIAHLDDLLRYAGYERQKFDINKRKHLRIVSESLPDIDFEKIGADKFRHLRFESSIFRGNGSTLLRNFGDGTESSKNLDSLLKKAGYQRKRMNLRNPKPTDLRKVLNSAKSIDYESVCLSEFRLIMFDHPLFRGMGLTLLKNYRKGTCDCYPESTEQMDLLLKHAGFKRDKLNLENPNPIQLKSVLCSIGESYSSNTRAEYFRNLDFDTSLFKGKGVTILRNFGDKSESNSNLQKLLKCATLLT